MTERPQIIYFAASSLDGFIATESGGVEWLAPYEGTAEDYGYGEFFASVDAILMGSGTYEFAMTQETWPAGEKPTWVFSRRRLRVVHPSIRITTESPDRVVEMLQRQGVRRVWLMGGGRLASSMRDLGLISEYIIAIVPIVLGGGIPLLARGERPDTLRLVGVEPYPSGIVSLHYRNAPGTVSL